MRQEWLSELGVPGLVGIGLLLFSASFHFGTIAPIEAKVGDAQSEIERLSKEMKKEAGRNRFHVEVGNTKASRGPGGDIASELAERLSALGAAESLDIGRTAYTVNEKPGDRRLEVSFAASGSYVATRQFLRKALAESGDPRLVSLRLQRQRASDSVIAADVKLSYRVDQP